MTSPGVLAQQSLGESVECDVVVPVACSPVTV